jgi:hypothetical protein
MEESIGEAVVQELAPAKSEIRSEEDMPGLMPEAGHTHIHPEHKSGNRWLDVIVAVSVIFISAVSLVVSVNHGRTMEKMVEQNQKMVDQNQKLVVANTLPILSIFWREIDDTGKPMLQETISNGGVGPAIIEKFEIRYKGVAYHDHRALLRACCAASYLKAQKIGHPKVYYSNISGFILPARQNLYPITIKPDKDALDLYSDFRNVKDSDDITYYACYCSVLDECWETNFDNKRPQPVKECKVSPNEKLW